jgi:hypothetical protein
MNDQVSVQRWKGGYMFPRALLGVLALALMMTVTLVSPAGATIKVYDVSFHTVYPSFNDVDGEFVAQFDPSQSIHSFATIKSLSGLPPPFSNGIFDYAKEPIPQSPTNAERFVLTLTVHFGVPTGFDGTFKLRTFGYDQIPPIINCLGAVVTPSFLSDITATSCTSRLVSLGSPPPVPLPPGFFLFGTGLLGLAGAGLRHRWRL